MYVAVHLCETIGAALFTIGSLMYMFGAISDFRHIKKELREGVHAVGAGMHSSTLTNSDTNPA